MKGDRITQQQRMFNGQSIMNALAALNYKATFIELFDHIENFIEKPAKLIRPEVKRVLHSGITNGFLIKRGKNYLVPTYNDLHKIDGSRDENSHANEFLDESSDDDSETSKLLAEIGEDIESLIDSEPVASTSSETYASTLMQASDSESLAGDVAQNLESNIDLGDLQQRFRTWLRDQVQVESDVSSRNWELVKSAIVELKASDLTTFNQTNSIVQQQLDQLEKAVHKVLTAQRYELQTVYQDYKDALRDTIKILESDLS